MGENVPEWCILDSVDSTLRTCDSAKLTRDELVGLVRQQGEVIVRQDRLIEQLRKQIEELNRKSHRQANPFSKNRPKADPKSPGRKPRQGVFKNRPAPPEQPSDRKVQASTPERCPSCGGDVDLERVDTATVTEIPKKPEPVVTRYSVPVCRCRKCGKSVRGEAPGLAKDQLGATAHRVGEGAMAMAHMLHYDLGIPVRKVPAVLLAQTGVEVTASAITQDAMRQAEGPVGVAYEGLREGMRESPVVHTDDTGWKIGGKGAFLMGFDSDRSAVFQIRFQHRNQEVQQIIPADFGGVLVTGRSPIYDATAFDGMRHQKCLGHILKNISMALETKAGPSRCFGLQLKALLQEAMGLGKSPPEEERIEKIENLELRLNRLLRHRRLKDEDNQRLLDGIGLQMDRGRLLTFLHVPGVEPTNNRAERMLRPAVIARKVSHCSKNEGGAYATSAFLSVIQTARKGISGGIAHSLSRVLAALASPLSLLHR